MRSRHGSRVTQLHHRRAGGCAPWRPSLTSGRRGACQATASPRRGRPYSPRTPRLAPGPRLRTGRSGLFGGWDAHWATGGRDGRLPHERAIAKLMPAKVRAGRVTLSDANPPIRTGEFGHRPLHRELSRGSVNDGDTSAWGSETPIRAWTLPV